MLIVCMELSLIIVDDAAVTATFLRAVAATVAPIVDSTGLNTGKLSRQLVLWNLGNSVCEIISRLQICNSVKVSRDIKILYCVG